MRKRYHHHDHSDSVAHVSSLAREPRKKEKVRVHSYKNKSRKKWWLIVGALAVVCVGILVYEGVVALTAANNILASDISIKDLVSRSDLKQADGRTNILLLGKGGDNHNGGQLTDTIQVLSINRKDNRVAFISLPRDLQITLPGGGVNKLNYAYADGYLSEKNKDKKNDSGSLKASQVVEKIIGVPVHYYVTVDFVGFRDLVDNLGGVTVDVQKALDDPYYPKDTITADGRLIESEAYAPVHIKAGVQLMDGDIALKYSRSRETTSDFDRSARQQTVMFAVKDKALTLGVLANPVKVSNTLSTLGKHLKTNLDASELKELVNILEKVDKDKSVNEVIDNNPKDGLLVSTSEGGYYLKPKSGNYLAIQQLVKNIFADAKDSYSISDITVNVFNGSGETGLAKKLADELKAQGFTVDQVVTDTTISKQSTIYDGTNGSSALATIKSHFNNVKIEQLDSKGIIKVIIGQDYGK